MNLFRLALLILALTGCSRDKDEPRAEPGNFLRLGGDVVVGGKP